MSERLPDIKLHEIEPLQDECGVVGILASEDACLFDLGLAALSQLQTRGYDGGGWAALQSNDRILLHKRPGRINEAFSPGLIHEISQHPFYNAQFQVRYGTSGDFSPENVQPFITRHALTHETFMVSHNGQFSSGSGVVDDRSDTALFVDKLAHSSESDWEDRIKNTLVNQKGAWSLIIGTKDTMFLARDPLGIRPLYFAQGEINGVYVTIGASETRALSEVGFPMWYEVMPGELIICEKDQRGFRSIQFSQSNHRAHCSFENVYTKDERGKALLPRLDRLDVNNSLTVAEVRHRCGLQLANEAPLTLDQVDFVIGIPGTAITGGIAYSKALNLPYIQAIKDKHTPEMEQRTFMQAQIEGILKKVQNHFRFDEGALLGKRVCLVDDSIVRGNVSKGLVQLLTQCYGVTEIHMRVLCPPIDKACYLGINTRRQNELIAATHMQAANSYDDLIERIRQEIGANSLAYLSSEGLLWAETGSFDSAGFCMGCMVGRKHPIDRFGQLQ